MKLKIIHIVTSLRVRTSLCSHISRNSPNPEPKTRLVTTSTTSSTNPSCSARCLSRTWSPSVYASQMTRFRPSRRLSAVRKATRSMPTALGGRQEKARIPHGDTKPTRIGHPLSFTNLCPHSKTAAQSRGKLLIKNKICQLSASKHTSSSSECRHLSTESPHLRIRKCSPSRQWSSRSPSNSSRLTTSSPTTLLIGKLQITNLSIWEGRLQNSTGPGQTTFRMNQWLISLHQGLISSKSPCLSKYTSNRVGSKPPNRLE